MQKKHFFLGDNIAKAREYQPHRQVFAGQELPQRDRQGHADFIKSRYEMAVNSAISILEEREKTGSLQPMAFMLIWRCSTILRKANMPSEKVQPS